MRRSEFEQLVGEALDSLPEEFGRRLENVEVIVERRVTPYYRRELGLRAGEDAYGCYLGTPLTERTDLTFAPLDTIVIFREPLERDYPSPDDLRDAVRRTVLHEIAHHFGISDARLEELDAY